MLDEGDPQVDVGCQHEGNTHAQVEQGQLAFGHLSDLKKMLILEVLTVVTCITFGHLSNLKKCLDEVSAVSTV